MGRGFLRCCPILSSPCQAKLSMGFGDKPPLELLRVLAELQQRCAILKEENQMLVRLGGCSELGVREGSRFQHLANPLAPVTSL